MSFKDLFENVPFRSKTSGDKSLPWVNFYGQIRKLDLEIAVEALTQQGMWGERALP